MVVVAHAREDQRCEALLRANKIRLAGAALKRELAQGKITFGQALRDPRAGSLTLAGLLIAQRRWGRKRMLRFLAFLECEYQCKVSETKRIDALTERQLCVIEEASGLLGRLNPRQRYATIGHILSDLEGR